MNKLTDNQLTDIIVTHLKANNEAAPQDKQCLADVLNDMVFDIQNLMGQEAGDVAGIYFSEEYRTDAIYDAIIFDDIESLVGFLQKYIDFEIRVA